MTCANHAYAHARTPTHTSRSFGDMFSMLQLLAISTRVWPLQISVSDVEAAFAGPVVGSPLTPAFLDLLNRAFEAEGGHPVVLLSEATPADPGTSSSAAAAAAGEGGAGGGAGVATVDTRTVSSPSVDGSNAVPSIAAQPEPTVDGRGDSEGDSEGATSGHMLTRVLGVGKEAVQVADATLTAALGAKSFVADVAGSVVQALLTLGSRAPIVGQCASVLRDIFAVYQVCLSHDDSGSPWKGWYEACESQWA